jgi:fumarate reductase subunit D
MMEELSMSTPAVPPMEIPGLSEPERIIDTFIAPSKTFADIRRNASWWAPWVIMSIFALLFSFAVSSKIGWDQVVQNEIAKNPKAMERIDKMPPEQRENMLTMQANISKGFGFGVPVVLLIIIVVVAAVLMATFNFGMGAKVEFGQSMAIVTYSYLPSIVSTVLAIVAMFAGADPEGFNIRNPVATNPAYFLSPTGNKFVYGIASMFDVVAIWMIILMGIGFAANSKVKRGTAIGVIAAWFVVIKLVGAVFATIF